MSLEQNCLETKMDKQYGLNNCNQRLDLLDLPEEIISLIISHLDGTSKVRLWETSSQLRNSLRRNVHLNYLNLAHRRMPRTICDFLRDYAVYIRELNLKCAKGFTESGMVSALVHLKNLCSLDVRQTSMTLNGASEVCAACPRLVSLACELTDSVTESGLMSPTIKQSFAYLESVHFVVSFRKYMCPLSVLERATNLKGLKITYCSLDHFDSDVFQVVKYQHPNLQFFSFTIDSLYLLSISTYLEEQFNTTWDFVIEFKKHKVYLSPSLYRSLPSDSYLFKSKSVSELQLNQFPTVPIHHEIETITLHAFHSDLIQLNPGFKYDMLCKMNAKISRALCKFIPNPVNQYNYFSICSCTHSVVNEKSKHHVDQCLEGKSEGLNDNRKSEVLVMDEELQLTSKLELDEVVIKSKKVSRSYDDSEEWSGLDDSECLVNGEVERIFDLDLCTLLGHQANRKIKIELTNHVHCDNSRWCRVISPANFEWLHNVISLRLFERCLSRSVYEVLFQQCTILETLEIECNVKELSTLIECVHFCRVIRNIRLDITIYYFGKNNEKAENILSDLFCSLAGCPRLANVHITIANMEGIELEVSEDAMEKFFLGCRGLLCLSVYHSATFHEYLTNIINNVLRKNKMEMNIDFSFLSGYDEQLELCTSEEPDNIFDLEIMNRNLKYSQQFGILPSVS